MGVRAITSRLSTHVIVTTDKTVSAFITTYFPKFVCSQLTVLVKEPIKFFEIIKSCFKSLFALVANERKYGKDCP
jgi:hypothetical protein